MAGVAARGLKVGTIIDRTLGVVEINARAALLYLVVLTAINGGITWYSLTLAPMGALAMSLLSFLIGVVGTYLLLGALLRKTGLCAQDQRETFYPFLALTLVYASWSGPSNLGCSQDLLQHLGPPHRHATGAAADWRTTIRP